MSSMRLLWEPFVKFFRAWHARRALLELSDRTLKDIGVRRGDIGSLFR